MSELDTLTERLERAAADPPRTATIKIAARMPKRVLTLNDSQGRRRSVVRQSAAQQAQARSQAVSEALGGIKGDLVRQARKKLTG